MKSKNTFLFLACVILITGCSGDKKPLEISMEKKNRNDTGEPFMNVLQINVSEDIDVNKILISALDENGKPKLDCFGDRTAEQSYSGLDGVRTVFKHDRKNATGEGYHLQPWLGMSAKDGIIKNSSGVPEPRSLKAGDILSQSSMYCANLKNFTIEVETNKGNFTINKDF